MKIGIIGMGFVGGATSEVLGRDHEIISYDKYKEPYKNSSNLSNAEVIFICVPTPEKKTGEIDLSIIEKTLDLLKDLTMNQEAKPLIVIRSTCVPGTSEKLAEKYPFNFASNPEFLREKHAKKDMKNTQRIILGTNSEEDKIKLLETYKPVFPNAEYVCVNNKTAEMIKYASNTMLAGQIALANEIYQICETLGIDYENIRKALLIDKRIARNINVPGPDGDLGFGGKCFPKDLKAIMFSSEEKGYNPKLLKEIWELNERLRKDKDWLNIIGATSENNNFSK